MGPGRFREEAVLFAGSLFPSIEVYSDALGELKEEYGDILLESPPLPWIHSDYYSREMGTSLYRNFVFFDRVIDTAVLVDAKLKIIELEKKFSKDGKRLINIDPGYVSLAKVVLASKKNYSHRIYLGKLVFAELELIRKEGRFHPLPYTYMDYRDEENIKIFEKARGLFKRIIDSAV